MGETTAEVRHGANVLRAVAANLSDASDDVPADVPPSLRHPTARDALTLLAWRGPSPSDALHEALALSQPAAVRLTDRLERSGLVTRVRRAGDRRTWLELTPLGSRTADRVLSHAAEPVEAILAAALPDPAERARFVAALDRVAGALFGDALDTGRFCRRCDVDACLADDHSCPSARAAERVSRSHLPDR